MLRRKTKNTTATIAVWIVSWTNFCIWEKWIWDDPIFHDRMTESMSQNSSVFKKHILMIRASENIMLVIVCLYFAAHSGYEQDMRTTQLYKYECKYIHINAKFYMQLCMFMHASACLEKWQHFFVPWLWLSICWAVCSVCTYELIYYDVLGRAYPNVSNANMIYRHSNHQGIKLHIENNEGWLYVRLVWLFRTKALKPSIHLVGVADLSTSASHSDTGCRSKRFLGKNSHVIRTKTLRMLLHEGCHHIPRFYLVECRKRHTRHCKLTWACFCREIIT